MKGMTLTPYQQEIIEARYLQKEKKETWKTTIG